MAEKKFLDLDGLLYFWNKIKSYVDTLGHKKVDKVEGKGLSTNDYTTEDKQKLAGLNNFTLPTASPEILGGVKVGEGLSIGSDGVLKATGGGTADAVAWENVTGRPTSVSQFTNDKKYQTQEEVERTISDKGFLTEIPAEYVTETELTQKGYQTSEQIEHAITSKGYITAIPEEYVTDTELSSKGYQTAPQVESVITGKGYQTASQVQESIRAAVAGITGISFSIVEQLPASGKVGVIYLMKAKSGSGQNIYEEYIWVESKFELLGTTAVDLSGYYNSENLIPVVNGEIDSIFA